MKAPAKPVKAEVKKGRKYVAQKLRDAAKRVEAGEYEGFKADIDEAGELFQVLTHLESKDHSEAA